MSCMPSWVWQPWLPREPILSQEETSRCSNIFCQHLKLLSTSTLLYVVNCSLSRLFLVHLEILCQVAGLRKTTSSSTTQWFVSTSPPPEGNPIPPYDHIVLATPFQSSLITLLGSSATFDPPVEYIHLHVTLVATKAARPNPAYFGLKAGSTLPSMILTTHNAVRRDPAAPEPEFNSLSYHGLIRPKDHPDGPEWLVKIFSKDLVTDDWLEKVFGNGNVGWVYRKEVRLIPRI
jgi:Prenylcysteine lyase